MTTAAWAARAEGGSPRALRALLNVVLRLGPTRARVVLPPLVAWQLLTDAPARAASRDYLGRVLGRPPRLRDVARHFNCFGAAVLERIFLLAGRDAAFDIAVSGLEHVNRALAGGRGCVLLGAHIGSFEVLRCLARHAPVPVHPVMYRRNAGALTVLLDELAPGLREAIIEIGEPGSMLRAHEAVRRGEIVGLLADRCPQGEKTVRVPFFGREAAFPTGPFVFSATLDAPVILFYGLRIGALRYEVRFEVFAERLHWARASRDQDMAQSVARFAEGLEAACRSQPFNWFNFFPFWESSGDAGPDPSQPGVDIAAGTAAAGSAAGRRERRAGSA